MSIVQESCQQNVNHSFGSWKIFISALNLVILPWSHLTVQRLLLTCGKTLNGDKRIVNSVC